MAFIFIKSHNVIVLKIYNPIFKACEIFVLSKSHEKTALLVELVDTLDLGSSAERCEGSSPSESTNKKERWSSG